MQNQFGRLALCAVLTVTAGACEKAKFETYNVALAGAFIPFEAERRPALIEAIPDTDADVVCLQEVWTQEDKDAIIAAAAAEFPYAVSFVHDFDTVVDDPADQSGNIPPAPTVAPCAPPDTLAKAETTLECLVENCSTIPGSEQGQAVSIDCAIQSCTLPALALLGGTAQDQQCYACAITSLPIETFEDILDICTTELNAGLAFRGQSGVVMLSRYPLTDAKDFVMPGTYNRRVVISATANLPNYSKVDVHCTHLTPIFSNPLFIYTGQYGDGTTGPSAWEAEQQLQADKVLDYISAESGHRPAIFLGDLNASRAFAGPPPIDAEGAATLDLLETELKQGVFFEYEPLCTFCGDNPIIDSTTSGWIDHIYLYRYPRIAVKSTARTFDDNVLEVPDGLGGTQLIPLSDHYGLRSEILIIPGLH